MFFHPLFLFVWSFLYYFLLFLYFLNLFLFSTWTDFLVLLLYSLYTFLLPTLCICWLLLLLFEPPLLFHSILLLFSVLPCWYWVSFCTFNHSIICHDTLKLHFIHFIVSIVSDKYISVCITIFYLMFFWARCLTFWWLSCFLFTVKFSCTLFVFITYFCY